MRPPETERHKVAVVRVEIRDRAVQHLLIELLEVGQEQEADRLLGSATSAEEACRVLAAWLGQLTETSPANRLN
jgi:hypothetical protein